MLEAGAVEKIVQLAETAAGKGVMFEDAEGRQLSTRGLHTLPLDEPAPLALHSLQGLVDYVDANRDQLAADRCVVHVCDPINVYVRSELKPRQNRHTYVAAVAIDAVAGRLGGFQDMERTIIMLQSLFEDVGDRSRVLEVLGNVTANAELQTQDDGVSQKVTTRLGLKDYSPVPNPVMLAPFRTFREVEQPTSPFILRMKQGQPGEPAVVALFEADGGAWRLDAVEAIAAWLDGKVGDFAVLR